MSSTPSTATGAPDNHLFPLFRSYMDKRPPTLTKRIVTIPPRVFKCAEVARRVKRYGSIEKPILIFDSYTAGNTNAADNFNILVIGPTGSGKSNLVNVIFNLKICESGASEVSATNRQRDVRFVGGFHQLNDKERKRVVVADTIGLADQALTPEEVQNTIRNKVMADLRTIDLIIVVVDQSRVNIHMESGQRNTTSDDFKSREQLDRLLHSWIRINDANRMKRLLVVATLQRNEPSLIEDRVREYLNLAADAPATIIGVDFPDEEGEEGQIAPYHEDLREKMHHYFTLPANEKIVINRTWGDWIMMGFGFAVA